LNVVPDDGIVREGHMAGVSERVLMLEEKVQTQGESFQLLRQDISLVRQDLSHLTVRVDRVEQRLDRVEDKLDRGFLWLVGLQVGVLAAVVTGFVAVMGQLAGR
jgi:tetrahydromethanopterin S-methyltransferase subunit G